MAFFSDPVHIAIVPSAVYRCTRRRQLHFVGRVLLMLSGATLSVLAVRGGVLGPPVRQGLFLLGLGAKAESSTWKLAPGWEVLEVMVKSNEL